MVIDTRELGRRAGSMRRTRLTVPAPPALGTGLVGVPADAELELDLRLEAVMEGILVSGQVRAPLAGECSRCLDPLTATAEVELQKLFVYPDLSGDVSGATEDDLGQLVDDRLDLEPLVRDAVVLALPLSPRCQEDCPGLCATCGDRLADLPADHVHPVVDVRWAALSELSSDQLAQNDVRHNGADASTIKGRADTQDQES